MAENSVYLAILLYMINKLWTYVGSSKVGLKRKIVHHNQLKRFYETIGLQEKTIQSEQTPRLPVAEDVNTAENKNDVVIVVDGPDTDDDRDTQLHQDFWILG